MVNASPDLEVEGSSAEDLSKTRPNQSVGSFRPIRRERSRNPEPLLCKRVWIYLVSERLLAEFDDLCIDVARKLGTSMRPIWLPSARCKRLSRQCCVVVRSAQFVRAISLRRGG